MDKIKVGSTYGYLNFITPSEQEILLSWSLKNQHKFYFNPGSSNRLFAILQNFHDAPMSLVDELKSRIINMENIRDYKPEPRFTDYIGFINEHGAIHPHMDFNKPPYTHTRYNVIISYPDQGGESIYGDEVNSLQELMVWKCVAGKVTHGSMPVIGSKPRITLSLGFLIND